MAYLFYSTHPEGNEQQNERFARGILIKCAIMRLTLTTFHIGDCKFSCNIEINMPYICAACMFNALNVCRIIFHAFVLHVYYLRCLQNNISCICAACLINVAHVYSASCHALVKVT